MYKKVSLKITETSPTGKQKRCLMKMFPDTKVETIRKQYMTLRDIFAAADVVFTLDGKGLHDNCSLAENSLTKLGYTYTLELKLRKDVKEFVEKKEVPKEVPRMESISNIKPQNVEMSSSNLLSQNSSSASLSSGSINAQSLASLPSSQQPTTSVKFKLKIQEKVEGQVISCDIEATSTMLLEKVTTMYCKHRKYNAADYVFAYNGTILDVKKSLIALGVGKSDESGKTFLINCFHKDKVTVK